jgi:hypothetical protein
VPFLRVVRDKRGYETTYLMHWYREGNRSRSRILYVFRTPGGVRVGRDPFEPDVLRQIEAEHPDIQFDWSVVRENQQVVEASTEPRRRRPRRDDERESDASGPPPDAAPTPARAIAEPPAPLPPIPSTIQGATPDEQIAFLAGVYPIVRERIAARSPDPVRLETLLALAERLNPDAWTDADQITTGLQQAAEALERLAHVLAKRRRRPRRKPRGAVPVSAGAEPAGDLGGENDVSDGADESDTPEAGDAEP